MQHLKPIGPRALFPAHPPPPLEPLFLVSAHRLLPIGSLTQHVFYQASSNGLLAFTRCGYWARVMPVKELDPALCGGKGVGRGAAVAGALWNNVSIRLLPLAP